MDEKHREDIHPRTLSHMVSGGWPRHSISPYRHVDLARSERLNIVGKQFWIDSCTTLRMLHKKKMAQEEPRKWNMARKA